MSGHTRRLGGSSMGTSLAFGLLVFVGVLSTLPGHGHSGGNGIVVADAAAAIPCVTKWGGPSANHTLKECTEDWMAWKDFAIQHVGQIVAPFLLGVGCIVCCPYVFCARYCCQCCGGSKMRPDNCCCGSSEYDEMPEDQVKAAYGSVSCAKFITIFVLFLIVGCVGLTFVGGQKFSAGIKGITTGLVDGINWVKGVIQAFVDGCARPDGTNPVSMSNFTKYIDGLDDVLTEYNKPEYAKWRTDVENAGYVSWTAAVPAVFVLLTVVSAFCNIQTCLPCCLNCCFFLQCFIYGLAGTLWLTVHLPLDLVCDEVNAQLERKPSIMQYYVVPMCEKEGFLKSAVSATDGLESDAARAGCDEMFRFCNSAINPATTQYQFNCNTTVTSCSTLAEVQAVANSMILKAGSSELCGAAPGGKANCTLANCAQYCNNTDLRRYSNMAIVNLGDATRIMDSFDTNIRPWLNCNSLLDRLVTMAKPMCDELPWGVYFMGLGCTLVVVTLILSICVTFRGQKRWFSPPKNLDDTYYYGGKEMDSINAPMSDGQHHYTAAKQVPGINDL